MGRQWLHAKRAVASLKKAQATGKLVREIMVAAKMGGADPHMNARLATAVEKARKESVSRDVIERAIKKGSGTGEDRLIIEQIAFEGYAPHKVPVIVEVLTDNPNRTAPEIRQLFKTGQLGAGGSNKFLFEAVGLVEAYHADAAVDLETAAIEAGANEVEPLSHENNDDIPEEATGARFIAARSAIHTVSQWLSQNGWNVVTSEPGYVAKNYAQLTPEQRADVGEFLQALEDHEDVHRVWAAVK
jgi:YebC/PmpR family DNA-binding regulatory protein